MNRPNHGIPRLFTHPVFSWGATLAFLLAASGNCPAALDPLLPAGELALIGSYKLDNVLLASGNLVFLPKAQSMFQGLGDTLDEAFRKGVLDDKQAEVLRTHVCTLTFRADHTFAFTNLPSAELNRTIQVAGTWSMNVYHVFDTYGYKISLRCDGYKLHANFINGDKPNPRDLSVFYENGRKHPVILRYASGS